MTDITNFTQSLIEMAEAVRLRPELEARIEALTEDNRLSLSTNEILRLRCDEAANTVSNLTAKLAEVTKERDDAMFRNLELDEKLEGFASVAGRLLGMVKPAPSVVPSTTTVAESSMVAPMPTESIGPDAPYWTPPVDIIAGQATQYDTVTGDTEPVTTPEPTIQPTTQPESDWSFDPAPTTREYEGQSYNLKPWWITATEWETKGGLPDTPNVMNF